MQWPKKSAHLSYLLNITGLIIIDMITESRITKRIMDIVFDLPSHDKFDEAVYEYVGGWDDPYFLLIVLKDGCYDCTQAVCPALSFMRYKNGLAYFLDYCGQSIRLDLDLDLDLDIGNAFLCQSYGKKKRNHFFCLFALSKINH